MNVGERKYYLSDIPLEQARQRWQQALSQAGLDHPLPAEWVPLAQAGGRVTAQACWARQSVPHYHAAAMDGYALKAADTQGVNDRNPVTLDIGPQAAAVDTGDPLPSWADAVVPIELVEGIPAEIGPLQSIRLRQAFTPWQNVRPMGEDMVATELILPAGHVLRAVDLGALAAAGFDQAPVVRKPRVGIIPTGDELVAPGQAPQPGEIIESNSLVLARQVEEWGGLPQRLKPVPDKPDQIRQAIEAAAGSHDLLLVLAGSSAGSEDFTAAVVEDMGQLLVHGIAVRPGHPVILGLIDGQSGQASTPIIGIPGYPVSAALTGEILLEPLLANWLGRPPAALRRQRAVLGRKVHSSMGDDEYVRVALASIDGQLVAQPLSRGAGIITSLVRADGLLVIPAGIQGHESGAEVEVQLYRPLAEIERSLMAQGSHDLTLDLMSQHLGRHGIRLTSSNVGSLGGLIALSKGFAHFAGSHLLDPESGEYNLAYVEKYLPGQAVTLLGLVNREQGLIVPPGNPRGLHDLADLAQEGIRFINRQRGAGTRQLLDFHLNQLKIEPGQIKGYEREEYTHLAVAAAVQSGAADCGLGIQAAAAALSLDFIPLYQERYDLVIPNRHIDEGTMQPLLDLLRQQEFRREIEAMPGYGIAPMGQLIAELPGN